MTRPVVWLVVSLVFLLIHLVGSLFSYYLFMTVGPSMLPVANFFANGVFGLLIEFLTTVVCKEAAVRRSKTREHTMVG